MSKKKKDLGKNIKKMLKSIKPHYLELPELHKIPELNIDESFFAEHGIDDLFKTMTNQNNLLKENNEKLLGLLTDQEIRESKSNRNWTLLTIIITIILGIPAFVPLLRKDYNQELLLEIQEQRRLNTLKEQTTEQFREKSIFLLDQLIQNQTNAKENVEN